MTWINPPAWHRHAACADHPDVDFFPDTSHGVRRAKAICHTCPVRVECLSWAIDHDEVFGVWGGMSIRERDQVRRRARVRGNPRLVARFLREHGGAA